MDVQAGVADTDSPVACRAQVCNEALAFDADEEGFERGVKLVGDEYLSSCRRSWEGTACSP